MAGYLDTRQMIIDTLMGRPEGTQVQPEDHQAYALNLLNYVRSIELSSGSILTGIAEADTVPIEPYDSRVAYITSVPQNTVRTFTYFKKENNEPITITTTNSSVFVILLWNTQYWEYQPLPVTVFENDSFVGYFECTSLSIDTNKTISSEINQLTTNMRILVKMNNINTQDNATLQIGLTDVKPLFYNGSRASSTNSWAQGEVVDIYYNGTNFISYTHGGAQFKTGEKVGDVGIDDEPTDGSDNLVKSGGVQKELALGAVYDVSAKNPTAGPNNDGKWASLSALLSDTNLNTLIPTSVRKGGMSIKFVHSSYNKYVQYRLMATSFSTTVTDWQEIVAVDKLILNETSVISSGSTYKVFSNLPTISQDTDAYFIVSGISSGVVSFNNSSYRELIRVNFESDKKTAIRIPVNSAMCVVSILSASSEDTPFTIQLFVDGAMSVAMNNAVDIKNITYINISEAYPTGGVNGTDVYTIDGARKAVPVEKRCQGLIIVYKNSTNRIRLEQKTTKFTDETTWVYGTWDLVNQHDIFSVNEYKSHIEPYNSRKSGRNATPDFARTKGQVFMYKSVDGYHLEENLNETDTFNNNDINFEQIIPQSVSLLNKPTILYESFLTLTTGSTFKIISGFTAVSQMTNAIVRICGISGKIAVLNSNYQRLYDFQNFTDGVPFIVKISPNVNFLYIEYTALAQDTYTYILCATDSENTLRADIQDEVSAAFNNGYNKVWGERSSLNLASLGTIQGKLSNTGELLADTYQRMSLQYIPVKAGTFIQTVVTSWVYTIIIAFFKQKADGAFEFVSYVYNKNVVFIPSGVTHIRLGFYVSYPSTTVLTEELLEANYEVKLITNSSIGQVLEFENPFEKNPVLKISNYTDWILGIPETYTETKMTHELPIRIIPGHRYRLEIPMDGTNITNAGWSFGKTYDNLDQFKTWLDGTPLNGRNFFLDAPVDANYLRIQVLGDSALTPSMADDIKLVDVTGKNPFESIDKIIDGWNHANSYAQGMTISNGYIFQAFADGYIDIYDVDTLALVQSVFAPTHEGVSVLHCNNLTFGEKYDVNDDFGVLYVNSDDANDPIVGIRVQLNDGVFTFTKVYEITPPEVDETLYVGNDEIIDIYNKRLVEVLYATGYGDMTMRVYDYDNLNDSAEFTLQNTFTSAKLYPLQGGMLRDELLYLCVGSGGGNKACIYVFNIFSGELVWTLDLRKPKFGLDAGEEMQGVALYKNQLYFSTTYGLYIYSQG